MAGLTLRMSRAKSSSSSTLRVMMRPFEGTAPPVFTSLLLSVRY